MTYRAIDVFHAAEMTYRSIGYEYSAKTKAEYFASRCGCGCHPEDSPNQAIFKDDIDGVIYEMLGSEVRKIFWDSLNAEATE